MLVLLYCLLVLPEGVIKIAEIAIGNSHSGPVADFLGNVQGSLMVSNARW